MRANALPLGDNTTNVAQTDLSRLSADDPARRQAWILMLAASVVAALAGACLFRGAQRRAARKAKYAAVKRCIHRELATPGGRTSLNAPFEFESWRVQSRSAHADPHAPVSSNAMLEGDNENVSFEPFEARYLQALSEEGIDLPAFLAGWRHAMDEDLAHLSALRRDGEFDRLRDVLHRLSGAVGLVGACSLMEALRHTSAAPPAHNARAIDVLTTRVRTLVMQLDTAAHAYRSTPR